MASLRGSSKRLLFEEDDQFSRDPGAGSCTCGDICNRVEKRPGCLPLLESWPIMLSIVSVWEQEDMACTNKPGPGFLVCFLPVSTPELS